MVLICYKNSRQHFSRIISFAGPVQENMLKIIHAFQKGEETKKQRGQKMVWSLNKVLLLMNQGKKIIAFNYEIYCNFLNDVKSHV